MHRPILFSKSALLLIALCFAIVAVAPGHARAATPTLTTLVSFNGTDGSAPWTGGLIADADGNLFGTTAQGGSISTTCPVGCGTVFEIAKTASGYASTPTTLVNFNSSNGNGWQPLAGLTADVSGNLFGTASNGGAYGYGTVFEIAKTASGYASTPTGLYSFCAQANCADGAVPTGGLIADVSGNLFGTTQAGGNSTSCTFSMVGCGTVFEIAKSRGGYANAPTVLVSFDGPDGLIPYSGLIIDVNGNLFGTTYIGGAAYVGGGADGSGTVYEVAKTAIGYANALTVLASFNGPDGAILYGDLITDANGNLFGTTYAGGRFGYGTVFEIAKTAHGYASTPTTLVSFNGFDGALPSAGLIVDANGNLFGTTSQGGATFGGPTSLGYGTVFEIAKTVRGYAKTPHHLIRASGESQMW